MSGTLAVSGVSGAKRISAVAAMSAEERRAFLDVAVKQMHAAQGDIVAAVGEVDRSQEYLDEGATSTESWLVERYGLSSATARSLAQVGKKAWDLPRLVGSLCAGEVSFDKVRVLADVATPETDEQLRDEAVRHSVRELADVARGAAEQARTSWSRGHFGPEAGVVRCNDAHRTISAQLRPEDYAEAKAALEAQVRAVPSDGETPLDQRRGDAFMAIVRSLSRGASGRGPAASPFFVVAHVPLGALLEDRGMRGSALAGELEHGGLIDAETVRRIACDATVVVGVDDDAGHTMYEGRARRFPTDAQRREVTRRDRHCRFPGCPNETFTNVHHIVAWQPGGRTDLDNLALLCLFHHATVHKKGWTMTGGANGELTFVGASGRVMTSRPSPLWTRVTAGATTGPPARGEGEGP